jgi:hypothetical protein
VVLWRGLGGLVVLSGLLFLVEVISEPGAIVVGPFPGSFKKKTRRSQLRDTLGAEGGVVLFELDDFGGDGCWQPGAASSRRGVGLKALLTELAIKFNPARDRLLTDAGFLRNAPATEALVEVKADGLEFELEGIGPMIAFGTAARAPLALMPFGKS